MGRKKDRWKIYCERLIRKIDPSFREPCYFVSRREAEAAGVLERGDFAGLTALRLSGDLHPWLLERGEWRGRGFATVVDIASIATTAVLEAVCLHEFSHHIERMAATASIAERLGFAADFNTLLSAPSSRLGIEQPEPPSDVKQRQHGPAFIRLCLHLEQRVIWRCDRFPFIVDTEVFGWPPRFQFRRALADEPRRLLNLPMVEIAAQPWPAEYTQFVASISPAAQHPFSEKE